MTAPVRLTHHQIDALIGPVRHVYGPLWMYRGGVYLGIIPVFILAVLVLILGVVTGLQLTGVLPPFRRGESATVLVFPVLFLGGVTAIGFGMLWRRWRLLGSRLILGEGGIAEWTPYDAKVVTAEGLGTEWVWHPLGPNNEGIPYTVHLALVHRPTGRRLYVTGFYQNAASVAKLLREKLAEKIHPGRWADLSQWRPDPNLERAATGAVQAGVRNVPPGNRSESMESE